MAAHKFEIGSRVSVTLGSVMPGITRASAYTVTKHLPADHLEPSYRIQGDGESHERIARENHLEACA